MPTQRHNRYELRNMKKEKISYRWNVFASQIKLISRPATLEEILIEIDGAHHNWWISPRAKKRVMPILRAAKELRMRFDIMEFENHKWAWNTQFFVWADGKILVGYDFCYHQHHQERKRDFKRLCRMYREARGTFLELKIQKAAVRTIEKHVLEWLGRTYYLKIAQKRWSDRIDLHVW